MTVVASSVSGEAVERRDTKDVLPLSIDIPPEDGGEEGRGITKASDVWDVRVVANATVRRRSRAIGDATVVVVVVVVVDGAIIGRGSAGGWVGGVE